MSVDIPLSTIYRGDFIKLFKKHRIEKKNN